jgi:hypothetical protein
MRNYFKTLIYRHVSATATTPTRPMRKNPLLLFRRASEFNCCTRGLLKSEGRRAQNKYKSCAAHCTLWREWKSLSLSGPLFVRRDKERFQETKKMSLIGGLGQNTSKYSFNKAL